MQSPNQGIITCGGHDTCTYQTIDLAKKAAATQSQCLGGMWGYILSWLRINTNEPWTVWTFESSQTTSAVTALLSQDVWWIVCNVNGNSISDAEDAVRILKPLGEKSHNQTLWWKQPTVPLIVPLEHRIKQRMMLICWCFLRKTVPSQEH